LERSQPAFGEVGRNYILGDGKLLTYSNIEITDYSPLNMQEAANA
jgi:hypothetical protein